MTVSWPDIPYDPWHETCSALRLYTQIAGKYRLARTPLMNHSWHATLYVYARVLTTSLLPDGPRGVEIELDLLDHAVIGSCTDGRTARFDLGPMSAATFHERFVDLLRELGAAAEFHGIPNEVPEPIPFVEDQAERPYDAEAVPRFFGFWGSFDITVTRFSGRSAPLHPGGVPGLPDDATSEAYSHEVSSAGFWPGGGGVDSPPSTLSPNRRRLASPMRPSSRKRPISMRRSASLCRPRRGAAFVRSRCRPDGIPREHLSGSSRSGRLGSAAPRLRDRHPEAASAL